MSPFLFSKKRILMNINAVSPIDSRYNLKIIGIKNHFSYISWYKYRVYVELMYFKLLTQLFDNVRINQMCINKFMDISLDFNENHLNQVLTIEKETLHDIKAIELFLKEKYNQLKIGEPKYTSLIHFGLTSQDINSVAFSIQFKKSVTGVILPELDNLVSSLFFLKSSVKDMPMLALTHGQPAIPTTLDKEIEVFITRLEYNMEVLRNVRYRTKFGGAIGKLNAHHFVYPNYDWKKIFNEFISQFELTRWENTTQISNYEDIIRVCSLISQINNTLNDLCVDMWLYISRGIFKLAKETKNQVGSSTMPQKVNPIDFENAEGNLAVANSGLQCLINKLSSSRLQRDLSDSTVLRNVGVYLSHCVISYKSIMNGISKLEMNKEVINRELESSPEILSEAIQCLLRSYFIEDAYNIIMELTSNKKFADETEFKNSIISSLKNSPSFKEGNKKEILAEICEKIRNLSVYTYIGI